jgi:hypothetical protein
MNQSSAPSVPDEYDHLPLAPETNASTCLKSLPTVGGTPVSFSPAPHLVFSSRDFSHDYCPYHVSVPVATATPAAETTMEHRVPAVVMTSYALLDNLPQLPDAPRQIPEHNAELVRKLIQHKHRLTDTSPPVPEVDPSLTAAQWAASLNRASQVPLQSLPADASDLGYVSLLGGGLAPSSWLRPGDHYRNVHALTMAAQTARPPRRLQTAVSREVPLVATRAAPAVPAGHDTASTVPASVGPAAQHPAHNPPPPHAEVWRGRINP